MYLHQPPAVCPQAGRTQVWSSGAPAGLSHTAGHCRTPHVGGSGQPPSGTKTESGSGPPPPPTGTPGSTVLQGCWSFTSWKHLRSHQNGYLLVTVHTHGTFIVLSQWENTLPRPAPNIPLSHVIRTLSGPVLAISK